MQSCNKENFKCLQEVALWYSIAILQELKHTVCTAKAGMQFLQMKYMEEIANLGKLTEFTPVSVIVPIFLIFLVDNLMNR